MEMVGALTSDKLFEATFDQAAVGMAIIAPDGKWVRVNDRFCGITHYPRDKLIGRDFLEITHPDDVSADAVHIGNLLSGKTKQCYAEKRFLSSSGEVVWVNASASLVRKEDGAPDFVIKIIEDITEQKQAKEKLLRSEERLELALSSGNLGTWSFDLTSQVLWFDRIAQSIFGIQEDTLDCLSKFKRLLHPEDLAVFDREHRQLLAGSTTVNVIYRIRRTDGSLCWAHVNGTINRSLNQLVGVVADVTEVREAQERLRILQNEFAHLARVNDLGEMAAAIAHEINQPLTAISNYLNAGIWTAEKTVDTSAAETVEKMQLAADQALRAGQIVRRLREFIGKGSGERESRFADQVIDAAIELATVDAGVKGVTLVRNAGASNSIVNVDVVQFQQVVVNLIRNAIDALSTNPKGVERRLTVDTSVGDSGKSVEFTITDTGPGIAPDICPKLFQPFTTSKPTGMGMGLSVCKRLIEAHDGSIWMNAPVAGGTAFHFSLPTVTIDA